MTGVWKAIIAALRNTSMHPLRSALTSLGIVAGVASVVMVSSIAEGTKKEGAVVDKR